jgi:hypothetical protein
MQLGDHQRSIIGVRRRRMEREAEYQQQQRGSKVALSCSVLHAIRLSYHAAMMQGFNGDGALNELLCEVLADDRTQIAVGEGLPELETVLRYISDNFAAEVWQTWPGFEQLLARAVTKVRGSPYAFVSERGIVLQSAKQARVYTAQEGLATIQASVAKCRLSRDAYLQELSKQVRGDYRPHNVLSATSQHAASSTGGSDSNGSSLSNSQDEVEQSRARVAAARAARTQPEDTDELQQLMQSLKQMNIQRLASQQQGVTTTSYKSKTLSELSAMIEDRLPKTDERVTARLAARKVELTSDEVRVYHVLSLLLLSHQYYCCYILYTAIVLCMY